MGSSTNTIVCTTDQQPSYGMVMDNKKNLYVATDNTIQVTSPDKSVTYISSIEGISISPRGLFYNSKTDILYIANVINGDTRDIPGNMGGIGEVHTICSYNLTTKEQIFNFIINIGGYFLFDPFDLAVSDSNYLFITSNTFNRITFIDLNNASTRNNNLTDANNISNVYGNKSSYICCNQNTLFVVTSLDSGYAIVSYDITSVTGNISPTILPNTNFLNIYGISSIDNKILIAAKSSILNYNTDTAETTTLQSNNINAISKLIIDNDHKLYLFASTNDTNVTIYSSTIQVIICFKEDTKILTDKGYIPIQDLKKGDLVKTLLNDYVPIDMIGKKDIHHPASNERIKDQLYKCSKEEYPEVFEDLVLTGCHCILVDEFKTEEEKQKTLEVNKDIYITDKKYRLPACVDKRSTVYEKEGKHTIYHFALENNDYYMNYGVFANGLLVETTSKRFMKELSGMKLIE